MRRRVFHSIFFSLMIVACSSGGENQPCSDTDPTCQREAKAKFSIVGGQTTYVENAKMSVDASGSIYDKLVWYLNGSAVPSCKNEELCTFSVGSQGIYEIKLETKVGGTGQVFLGLAGSPADSEDDKIVNIAVIPDLSVAAETSSTSTDSSEEESSTTCAAGVNDDMILIQDDDTCIAMKKVDNYQCRDPGYSSCADLNNAATICSNDSTNGHTWEVPDGTEISLMYDNRGTGSPETSNGFCVVDSSECSADSNDKPPFYIYNSNGAISDWSFISNAHSSSLTGGQFRSLRCITVFDPQ